MSLREIHQKYRGLGWKTGPYWVPPDLLGYSPNGTFFTVELKLTLVNKIRFHPTKYPFMKHLKNTFVLGLYPGQGEGSLVPWIRNYFSCEGRFAPGPSGLWLDACRLALERL